MRRLLGVVSFVAIVVSACGFSVSGSTDADAAASSGGSTSSGASGASSSSSGASGSTSSSSGGDSDASTNGEGGAKVDSGCNPIVIDDPLNTAVNTNLWIKANNDAAADYPKLETNVIATKAMTALIAPFGGSKRGGIWLKQRVPTRSFTVTFEYLVRCQGLCADGLAFSWTNPPNEAGLNTGGIGDGLGVPDAPGGAFSVMYIKNYEGGGTTKEPTLALHRLTTTMPGAIPSSQTFDDLVRQLRAVTIRYRNGNATFSTPGLSASGQAPGDFLGYVGFSAGSGSSSQAVFVSSFHGEFADCDLP